MGSQLTGNDSVPQIFRISYFFSKMKTQAIIAGVLLTVVNGAALVPALQPYASYAGPGSLAIGLWLLVRAAISRGDAQEIDEGQLAEGAVTVPVAPEPEVEAPKIPDASGEVEVVTMLGALQEKGRLVDFLMDDITAYSDAQVGGAARVVHQGCAAVLKEHFEISPVESVKEGSQVTVPADAPSGTYRLSGKVEGGAPFTGKLVHKGWKTTQVKLPRVIVKNKDGLPAIAPAQVEVG